MPQARHGGSGVWALAVVGSKLEGTGLEKLQMVQTHVAVLDGGASAGKTRGGPSGCRDGEEVLFREGPPAGPGERGCTEARLAGFGIRVILAEDLRKPPWEYSLSIRLGTSDRGEADIELKALDVLEVEGDRVLPGLGLVDVAYPMRCQVDLAILVVGELEFPWEHDVLAWADKSWDLLRAPTSTTHPSYNPTLSWTKSRSSSGRYEGRRAVVKSMCFRNIRHSWEQDVPMSWESQFGGNFINVDAFQSRVVLEMVL